MKKKTLATALLVVVAFLLVFSPSGMVLGQTPLEGRIIALDAGHGGTELGATYPALAEERAKIYEKDVNLAVVYTLKEKLETDDACVVLTRECDETISSRKERVAIAEEKCETVCGGECDVLVSVHHNGSTDSTHDGTMVIYTEKQDVPLATALHDALIAELGLPDEGYVFGGYGMTVFGHLVSALTEAYYTTNDCEADLYLDGIVSDNKACPAKVYGKKREPVEQVSLTCENPDETTYTISYAPGRVEQEAQALYDGLNNHFATPEDKPGERPK